MRQGGGGKSLSYIEAHDAIRTANEIFGVGGWGYTVKSLEHLGTEPVTSGSRKGFRVAYGAIVEVVVWGGALAFSDTGYGDSVEYSGSELTGHELARKEAVSDALKRALKNFGDQFGLGLYDAGRRADVDRRRKVSELSEAALKREAFKLAKERTGKDEPTKVEAAKALGIKVADLVDPEVLRRVLAEA